MSPQSRSCASAQCRVGRTPQACRPRSDTLKRELHNAPRCRAGNVIMNSNQRGAALALALWGIVVGGALLTVITVLALQEQRVSGAMRREQQAFTVAERGGAEFMSRWTVGDLVG